MPKPNASCRVNARTRDRLEITRRRGGRGHSRGSGNGRGSSDRESQRQVRQDAVEPDCPETCASSYRMLQEGETGHLPRFPLIKTGERKGGAICFRSHCETTKISKAELVTRHKVPSRTSRCRCPGNQGGPCLRDSPPSRGASPPRHHPVLLARNRSHASWGEDGSGAGILKCLNLS